MSQFKYTYDLDEIPSFVAGDKLVNTLSGEIAVIDSISMGSYSVTMTHKNGDTENIRFLKHEIELNNWVKQSEITSNEKEPLLLTQSESIIFVDCDDTLVMWGDDLRAGDRTVSIENPHNPGEFDILRVNEGHLRVLKDRYMRGSYIIVWSAGGYQWAETVVKALELEDYVHQIMSKPLAYMDDKDASQILGERIYLGSRPTYGAKK